MEEDAGRVRRGEEAHRAAPEGSGREGQGEREVAPRTAAIQAAIVTVVVVAFSALGAWLSERGLLAEKGGWLVVIDVALHALVLSGMVALLLRLSRQSWTSIGLQRPRLGEVVVWGIVATVLVYMANIFAVIVHLAITRPDLTQLGERKLQALDPLAAIPLVALIPIALVVGIYEELVFRGFLLSRMRAALSGKLSARAAAISAALASSAVFALGHLYQGSLGIVQTLAAGLAFSAIALWRRSIWPCIFAHTAIDLFGLIALRVLRPALDSMLPQ